MRWKNKTKKRDSIMDLMWAQEIVSSAYWEGFINWNVYRKALEKINTNINGRQTS